VVEGSLAFNSKNAANSREGNYSWGFGVHLSDNSGRTNAKAGNGRLTLPNRNLAQIYCKTRRRLIQVA